MTRLVRRLFLAVILGIVVYGAFAVYRGTREIGDSLGQFHWSAFAIACTLAFGNYLTRFIKWEYYLARLGIRGVPKLDSLLTFLSGLVLTVTPGKVGEVFKSLVLQQAYNVPAARTAPIVLAERLTDVLGIVILIVAGATQFSSSWAWVWVGSGTALVLMVLTTIGSDRFFAWLIGMVERAPERLSKHAPKVREAWQSLRTVTSARTLVLPTLLSVFAWSLEALALWVILRGFGQITSIRLCCFFYATATLAGAIIPVPGGLGITEGTLEEQLWHIGHVDKFIATSAMLLVRVATLWFAVFIGFVALFWMRARHPAVMREVAVVPDVAPPART